MKIATDRFTYEQPPRLLTPGVIAARLGVALHRVHYILESRGIRPVARAGRLRLFDAAAVERVRSALAAIDARRAGGAS